MYAPSHHPTAAPTSSADHGAWGVEASSTATLHTLTLVLAGMTSDDYLQWVRDHDPPEHGTLALISVRATPVGDRIQLGLICEGELPVASAAAEAVGFPIVPEVVAIESGLAEVGHSQPRRSPCTGTN
jgi:hypothetical protein